MGVRRRGRPLLPRLILAVAAVGLFLIAYQWGNQYRHGAGEPPELSGVLMRAPQPLPEFALTDARDARFDRSELTGHWSLIAFAPIRSAPGHRAVTRMIEIRNRIADRPDLQRQLRLLLVSADAAPSLAMDFERLSPAIAVLSAPSAELAGLRDAVGADPASAAVDDLPPLFLIDPDARLVAIFPSSQPAAEVAADLDALSNWPGLQSLGQSREAIGRQ
jgi:peroxiredoxin